MFQGSREFMDSMSNKGIQQPWVSVAKLLGKLQKTYLQQQGMSDDSQKEWDGHRVKPREHSTEQTKGNSYQHCTSFKEHGLWSRGTEFRLICHRFHRKPVSNSFMVSDRHRCLARAMKPSGIFVLLGFSRWPGWIPPTTADGKGSLITWTEFTHPTVVLSSLAPEWENIGGGWDQWTFFIPGYDTIPGYPIYPAMDFIFQSSLL